MKLSLTMLLAILVLGCTGSVPRGDLAPPRDLTRAERSLDANALDAGRDLALADRALPELRVDSRKPDLARPDLTLPDLRPPDVYLPPDLPPGPTIGKLCTPGIGGGCAAGESCIFIPGGSTLNGYCSKQCSTVGAKCTGGPAGSLYYCAFQVTLPGGPTVTFCGFFCALPGQTGGCPPTLSCSAQQQPPGSGQRPCLVP